MKDENAYGRRMIARLPCDCGVCNPTPSPARADRERHDGGQA